MHLQSTTLANHRFIENEIALITMVSLEKLRIYRGNEVHEKNISKARKAYDVFISAPMESSLDHNKRVLGRDQIMQIKRELEDICRFQNIFYAGAQITSESEFDSNSIALSENLKILMNSERYVFVYPEKKPSSTLVEIGIVLALKLPSLWLVKESVELPFLLRQAMQNLSIESELPKIIVQRYSNTDDILRFIRHRRNSLFS